MDIKRLNRILGNADLMLIDRILKGSFDPGRKILDAGCGELRNLHFFIKNGFPVYAIDKDEDIIRMSRLVARSIDPGYVTENLIHASIEENPFPDRFFDHILCLNVLHSATDTQHFIRMMNGLRRILRDDGYLFLSMEAASGIEDRWQRSEKGLYRKPSGESRLLFDEGLRRMLENKLNLRSAEPLRYLHIEGAGSWVYLWLKKSEKNQTGAG